MQKASDPIPTGELCDDCGAEQLLVTAEDERSTVECACSCSLVA